MNLPVGIRGRLVALGLLLIPVILVFELILVPLIERYSALNSDIVELEQDIARYQTLLAELPRLRSTIEQLDTSKPLAPYLLEGDNQALAAASLQRRLQQSATRLGVRVISLRVQPPRQIGPLERIAVEARLQSSLDALHDLLLDIEAGIPTTFVDDMNISVRAARGRVDASSYLDVGFTTYGFRSPETTQVTGVSRG